MIVRFPFLFKSPFITSDLERNIDVIENEWDSNDHNDIGFLYRAALTDTYLRSHFSVMTFHVSHWREWWDWHGQKGWKNPAFEKMEMGGKKCPAFKNYHHLLLPIFKTIFEHCSLPYFFISPFHTCTSFSFFFKRTRSKITRLQLHFPDYRNSISVTEREKKKKRKLGNNFFFLPLKRRFYFRHEGQLSNLDINKYKKLF